MLPPGCILTCPPCKCNRVIAFMSARVGHVGNRGRRSQNKTRDYPGLTQVVVMRLSEFIRDEIGDLQAMSAFLPPPDTRHRHVITNSRLDIRL